MHLAVITTPTRFPLGTGTAFEKFERACSLSKEQVSYHLPKTPMPANTTHILIAGPTAFAELFPALSHERSCGSYLPYLNLPTTTTYHPQTADEFRKVEDESDDAGDDEASDKDAASTRPGNYRFWIRQDTTKLLSDSFKTPPAKENFKLAPNLDAAIKYLGSSTGDLYLDIECRRGDQSLNCIGFALNDGPVCVVPVYDFRNNLFYGSFHKFIPALARAFRNNRVVIHNAPFDLFVLSRMLRVPFYRNNWCTMVAQHRCFPEAEKSLAHAIRCWTWLPYHKDLNIEHPRNNDDQYRLWLYNAKDVHTLREVHRKQVAYIKQDDGLAASVEQGNASIYPYLCTTLTGIKYDVLALAQTKVAGLRRLKQLERVARILIGDPAFNPNSTTQGIAFFHNTLGYEIQGRTETGKPAMGEVELYKLRLKYDNPLLSVVLAYRFLKKDMSMLEFAPMLPLR